VQHLLDNGVQILRTNSIGQRPLVYLNQAKIKIFYSDEKFIHEIIEDFLRGDLKRFKIQNICDGVEE